jgi:hypothetical protein
MDLHLLGIVRFEVAIPRLMKMDHNRLDFTGAQLGLPRPFNCSLLQQALLPDGFKGLAEIIDMAKQFQ